MLLGACVEPFSPTVDAFEDILVVEGLITYDSTHYSIKLSRTQPLIKHDSDMSNESGISVSLIDSDSVVIRLLESMEDPGVYTGTQPLQVGKTYILSIVTNEGKTYRSDPVEMKETPPIERVYFGRTTLPSNEYGDLVDGFQIYVDTGSGSVESEYYKLEWEETWEFVTPYHSFFDFDLQKDSIFERTENLSNCWIQSLSTNLNLISTENLSSGKIKGHPVRFISFRKSLLRVEYSIEVSQYALSQDSYYFWERVKETSEQTGSLYDKQPSQPIGNIRNINDPTEFVLGYFDIATAKSKRIFIKPNDLPAEVKIPSLYSDCLYGSDTVVSFSQIPFFLGVGYLIWRVEIGTGIEMALKSCIDCRLKGSNVKPGF